MLYCRFKLANHIIAAQPKVLCVCLVQMLRSLRFPLRWRTRIHFSCDSRPPAPPGNKLDLKSFKYIDKTSLLAKIMNSTETPTFIHAPSMRRIGKTVTIEMLDAMARGKRDMFAGMKVNAADSAFHIGEQKFSIIRMDFLGTCDTLMDTAEMKEAIIDEIVDSAETQHGLNLARKRTIARTFTSWLNALRHKEGNRPVIMLIDEYDAPVTDFLPQDPWLAQEAAKLLSGIYKAIKKKDRCFHKVFVTGSSKFSLMSMFSDANMFVSIMEEIPGFANLYGFTEKEIRDTYGDFIENKFGEKTLDDTIVDMKCMYNGYRVHPEQRKEDMLYNPWSVMMYLHTGTLSC